MIAFTNDHGQGFYLYHDHEEHKAHAEYERKRCTSLRCYQKSLEVWNDHQTFEDWVTERAQELADYGYKITGDDDVTSIRPV